ncbi:hypothetical protein BBJ28_00005376 [Nothophytophthora sp. Chile5]|nr:hypothetical protein BBJ28_00005376 [Nothophytophthora sp. Chile5]
MAALRAARGLVWESTRRACPGVSAGALASSALKVSRPSPFAGLGMARRAFMSTRAPDSLFSAPSYPMPASEDPTLWQEKYPRADPSHMWQVGSFPLLEAAAEEDGALSCSEDMWDTAGMLSSLSEDLPLRDSDSAHVVDALLRQMDQAQTKPGYLADSVVKKRRKKMNKHKHRKRLKALRMRTKKN